MHRRRHEGHLTGRMGWLRAAVLGRVHFDPGGERWTWARVGLRRVFRAAIP